MTVWRMGVMFYLRFRTFALPSSLCVGLIAHVWKEKKWWADRAEDRDEKNLSSEPPRLIPRAKKLYI
jgi:hypothetical protein